MEPTSTQNITRDNHFVPQLYLRSWAGADSKVWRYSLLVPHEKMPLWKPSSTAAIGYRQHLYTRIAGGKATDEVEKWLNREFEMPAVLPLKKAMNREPLTPEDWNAITRFMWMQDARTPANFLKLGLPVIEWVKIDHFSIKAWATCRSGPSGGGILRHATRMIFAG